MKLVVAKAQSTTKPIVIGDERLDVGQAAVTYDEGEYNFTVYLSAESPLLAAIRQEWLRQRPHKAVVHYDRPEGSLSTFVMTLAGPLDPPDATTGLVSVSGEIPAEEAEDFASAVAPFARP